jgi:hypothetical protein
MQEPNGSIDLDFRSGYLFGLRLGSGCGSGAQGHRSGERIGARMRYEEIRYEVSSKVATITLNRPAKLNAWTQTMDDEAKSAFGRAAADTNGLPCRKWSESRVRIGPRLKGEFDAASEVYA